MLRKVEEAKRLLSQPYMKNSELAAMAPPQPQRRGAQPAGRATKARKY
jgi:hypothetical protein